MLIEEARRTPLSEAAFFAREMMGNEKWKKKKRVGDAAFCTRRGKELFHTQLDRRDGKE
jgi:hypothetical protein